MKIREAFENLAKLNKINKAFGLNQEDEIEIYFDDYTRKMFKNWNEFKHFLKEEYHKDYIQTLLETESQLCLDGSNCYSFSVRGVECFVELYLRKAQ